MEMIPLSCQCEHGWIELQVKVPLRQTLVEETPTSSRETHTPHILSNTDQNHGIKSFDETLGHNVLPWRHVNEGTLSAFKNTVTSRIRSLKPEIHFSNEYGVGV
jgi:hypothetical protein